MRLYFHCVVILSRRVFYALHIKYSILEKLSCSQNVAIAFNANIVSVQFTAGNNAHVR